MPRGVMRTDVLMGLAEPMEIIGDVQIASVRPVSALGP
ncbi:MAG: hypothetical protein JWR51_4171 [Devosia sp.]|nr:hypothetical protein [Devosia sp.]